MYNTSRILQESPLRIKKLRSIPAIISDLVEFADVLKEVDTATIEPMTHPLQLFNVLREDIPQDILDRDEMLASVKEHEDGMIKVPNIL